MIASVGMEASKQSSQKWSQAVKRNFAKILTKKA
jgi:hypothetical protein